MKQDYNYPIKYAPMEIIQKIELPGYQPEIVSLGFVAAPCYLLEEKTTYYEDGSFRSIYKVVFCYRFQGFNHANLVEDSPIFTPSFDQESSMCINEKIVSFVSKQFDSVKSFCDQKNKQALASLEQHIPLTSRTQFIHYHQLEMESCYDILAQKQRESKILLPKKM